MGHKQYRAGWQPHRVMGKACSSLLLCPLSVLPLTAWPRWFSITPKCQPAREAKEEGRVWLARQRPDMEVKLSNSSHSHGPEQSHMATPNCKEGQEMQFSFKVNLKHDETKTLALRFLKPFWKLHCSLGLRLII